MEKRIGIIGSGAELGKTIARHLNKGKDTVLIVSTEPDLSMSGTTIPSIKSKDTMIITSTKRYVEKRLPESRRERRKRERKNKK